MPHPERQYRPIVNAVTRKTYQHYLHTDIDLQFLESDLESESNLEMESEAEDYPYNRKLLLLILYLWAATCAC